MLQYNETAIKPTAKIKKAVRDFARNGGGIHRMNVSDFSYYAFTAFEDSEGKQDFCGGWESKEGLQTSPFEYALNNNTGRLIKLAK